MRIYPVLALAALLCTNGYADSPSTNQDPRVILAKVLANRPVKDFSLKARLFVGSEIP